MAVVEQAQDVTLGYAKLFLDWNINPLIWSDHHLGNFGHSNQFVTMGRLSWSPHRQVEPVEQVHPRDDLPFKGSPIADYFQVAKELEK